MSVYEGVLADLGAEHRALDGVVAGLSDDAWELPTPAPGWAVRDQIGHLGFFDARALEAVTDPPAFAARVEAVRAEPGGEERWIESHLVESRSMAPGDLLEWWRAQRAALLEALAVVEPSTRVPWYGPPMGAVSFVSARLMETWAHGQDIVDAVGAEVGGAVRAPTDRLRHVAHLGVNAMGFSFMVHGLDVPSFPVRVELTAPSGAVWEWGPAGAADVVRGPALDFCLAVTKRRHLDDVGLSIEGPVATAWMAIAQAFAGPPGEGRRRGQFRSG